MNAAIEVKNLVVNLGGHEVLSDITVDIAAGKVIGLLGPSGAGKTTLSRSIVGRQRIAKGSITVLDLPAGSAKLREHIGYMTQELSVYPDLTIRENLRYFAAMSGCTKQQVEAAIAEVGLTKYAGNLVSKLSGGQKSRVSLAAALLGHPKLLVLDEPTVGVDPVLRKQLWELFGKIAKAGSTVLVTSHVMDEASRCDDLLLIRDGKLLAHGTPTELCERTGTKTVEESFLKLVGADA